MIIKIIKPHSNVKSTLMPGLHFTMFLNSLLNAVLQKFDSEIPWTQNIVAWS